MPLAGEQLTLKEALALCHVAGFRGPTLTDAVALMCAESGRYVGAWHDNVVDDEVDSTDRGLFQINDKFHPSMTDAMCYDPLLNAEYANKLSKDGTDFSPWMAYTSGAYEKFIPAVEDVKNADNWKSRTKLWEG